VKLSYLLALSALSALAANRDGSAPLRIYTDFQHSPGPFAQTSLQQELATLVSPIGLHLDWKQLSAAQDGLVSAALVVVTFKGRCDVQTLQQHFADPGALAWTHISDDEILPFVDVDCDRLREFLQMRLLRVEANLREQYFGRAMARVLGHELFHVFAGTRHHAREGVSQSAFSASVLMSDHFGFAEKEFRILRSTRLRPLLTAAKTSAGSYVSDGCAVCHGMSAQGTQWAPALRGPAKTLAAAFEKRSEDMYRRARNLKLEWRFPSDQEIQEILTTISGGMAPLP
jgi:hypothetical protein